MPSLQEIWEFFRAAFSHWQSWVAGVGGILLMILERWRKKELPFRTLMLIPFAVFGVAAFYAWRDEYIQRQELEAQLNKMTSEAQIVTSKSVSDCEFIPITGTDPVSKSDYWDSAKFRRTDSFQFAQRQIRSPRTDMSHAYEVMVKTDIELHPVAILVQYDAQIADPFDIDWGFVQMARIGQYIKRCLNEGPPKSFLLSFQSQWPSDVPLVIRIFAKVPISVTAIRRTKFEWAKSGN